MILFLNRVLTALTNATKALLRIIGAASRDDTVLLECDSDIVLYRRDTCKKCPHRLPVAGGMGRCRKCECFVQIKTRLATERCPLGRWR